MSWKYSCIHEWLVERNTQGNSQNVEILSYNVTYRRVYLTVLAVEKQLIFYICVCVLALVIQHSMRMRRIAICGLSGYTIFFHCTFTEYKMCVFIFSTNIFLKNISFLQELSDILSRMYTKTSVIIFIFWIKIQFSRKIFANYSITIFMKILPAKTELSHVNEQTDITWRS